MNLWREMLERLSRISLNIIHDYNCETALSLVLRGDVTGPGVLKQQNRKHWGVWRIMKMKIVGKLKCKIKLKSRTGLRS